MHVAAHCDDVAEVAKRVIDECAQEPINGDVSKEDLVGYRVGPLRLLLLDQLCRVLVA